MGHPAALPRRSGRASIAGRVLEAVVARPVSVGVPEVERRARKDELAAAGAPHLPAGDERSEPLPQRPVRAAVAACRRAPTATGALDASRPGSEGTTLLRGRSLRADRHGRAGSCRSHPVTVEGVLLEQPAIVLGSHERAGVAGKRDDRQRTEDGVDGAALEAELAQVRAAEQSTGCLQQLGGGRSAQNIVPAKSSFVDTG